jgi:hypothetical protein
MEPVSGKGSGAVLVLFFGGGTVLLGGGECTRYGSSDRTLLGIMPSGTRSDTMSDIIIKLRRNGFHGLIGRRGYGRMVVGTIRIVRSRIAIIFIFVVVGRGLDGMMLPDGFVDVGKGGIKAVGDTGCFEVTGSLQEGEGIGLDADEGILYMGGRRGRVIVEGGSGLWVKEGLYLSKFDKDTASGLIAIDDHVPSRDMNAERVEYLYLVSKVVEERMLMEIWD